MATPPTEYRGASGPAIRHHYDVGNGFYQLWLDPTLTYSCALWAEADRDDSLEIAQTRKLDYHVEQARADVDLGDAPHNDWLTSICQIMGLDDQTFGDEQYCTGPIDFT